MLIELSYGIGKAERKNLREQEEKVSSGRPVDALREEAFRQICEYFEENDDEQQTIAFLIEKCRDFYLLVFHTVGNMSRKNLLNISVKAFTSVLKMV